MQTLDRIICIWHPTRYYTGPSANFPRFAGRSYFGLYFSSCFGIFGLARCAAVLREMVRPRSASTKLFFACGPYIEEPARGCCATSLPCSVASLCTTAASSSPTALAKFSFFFRFVPRALGRSPKLCGLTVTSSRSRGDARLVHTTRHTQDTVDTKQLFKGAFDGGVPATNVAFSAGASAAAAALTCRTYFS